MFNQAPGSKILLYQQYQQQKVHPEPKDNVVSQFNISRKTREQAQDDIVQKRKKCLPHTFI